MTLFWSKQERIRPSLVLEALQNDKPIYCFGLGSNMLRSKVEDRNIEGDACKIEILRMEPGYIKNHRLTFRHAGFPPMEPCFGTLQPTPDETIQNDNDVNDNKRRYRKNECHGALIQLTSTNYELLMGSEGVGTKARSQSKYQETIVTVIPYQRDDDDEEKDGVQAVALQSREQLSFEPYPSLRYMTLLRDGAKELGLHESYQDFLNNYPIQHSIPTPVKALAGLNLIFVLLTAFVLRFRAPSELQSWFVYRIERYLYPISPLLNHVLTSIVLFPGAITGLVSIIALEATGTTPPVVKRVIAMIKGKKKKHHEKTS